MEEEEIREEGSDRDERSKSPEPKDQGGGFRGIARNCPNPFFEWKWSAGFPLRLAPLIVLSGTAQIRGLDLGEMSTEPLSYLEEDNPRTRIKSS